MKPLIIDLSGCGPIPLAGYLKALGILRIVATQLDPLVQGWWDGTFHLATSVSEEKLVDFFVRDYAPTPIVAPWNGGSGFYGSHHDIVEALGSTTAPRLHSYSVAIQSIQGILDDLGITSKPADSLKATLLTECRNRLSDEAVEWLDAVAMMTRDDPKYPPLLGTGGNDGNLEFTNNFMQNLERLMRVSDGEPAPDSQAALRSSLFGTAGRTMVPSAIGQFSPGQAGGPNASAGFSGESLINPWDFVLMMEGSIVFASAATRKHESTVDASLSYPFTVRPSGVGAGSVSFTDETSMARAEMWLPLWSRPTAYNELAHLFREGRVQMKASSRGRGRGYRSPRDGLDFARACASLGVDRGIDSFQRYAFLMRSGKSYLAVPLSQFRVHRRLEADLLNELDGWLSRLKAYCDSKESPESFHRPLANIKEAMFDLAQFGGGHRIRRLLLQLSQVEQLCVHNVKARAAVPPLVLRNTAWLEGAAEPSTAWMIALGLASLNNVNGSIPLRAYMSPVDPNRAYQWTEESNPPRVVYGEGEVEQCLLRLMQRRLLDWRQGGRLQSGTDDHVPPVPQSAAAEVRSSREIDGAAEDKKRGSRHEKPFRASIGVTTDCVKQFIYGSAETRRRVGDYLWALLPLTTGGAVYRYATTGRQLMTALKIRELDVFPLPWAYVVSKLVVSPDEYLRTSRGGRAVSDENQEAAAMPIPGSLVGLLAANQTNAAAAVAERRLVASGLTPQFRSLSTVGVSGVRCAAALMIPLAPHVTYDLRRSVIAADSLTAEQDNIGGE